MKPFFRTPMAFLMFILLACESKSGKDSTDVAEEKNEHKFEARDMKGDSEFLVDVASSTMMEVKLGSIAQTKAQSGKVREFGQMMSVGHTRSNEELKVLAAKKNTSLPASPGEDHQKRIDELSEKSGADFDLAYINEMVKDHQEALKEFRSQAEKSTDVEIKAFAQGQISSLQHHLDVAMAIQESLR